MSAQNQPSSDNARSSVQSVVTAEPPTLQVHEPPSASSIVGDQPPAAEDRNRHGQKAAAVVAAEQDRAMPSSSSTSANNSNQHSDSALEKPAAGGNGGTTPPPPTTTTVNKPAAASARNAQQRRSLMTKFATIHTDKYPENLRREFPMSNFDRNLTVEKARFDPQPLGHNPGHVEKDTVPPASTSPPYDQHNSQSLSTSRSATLPVAATAGVGGPAGGPAGATAGGPAGGLTTPGSMTPSVSASGIHTPSSSYSGNVVKPTMQSTKSRSEGDKPPRTAKKRRRPPPPVSGTATPAEVFHRNLIDAVSNVEDSDENEHYVYSYGGTGAMDHASYHSDLAYRSQSVRSSPPSNETNKWLNPLTSTASFFSDLFRSGRRGSTTSMSAASAAGDEEESTFQPHRPKLRNYVMDHRPKQLNSSELWDHHHWYDSKRAAAHHHHHHHNYHNHPPHPPVATPPQPPSQQQQQQPSTTALTRHRQRIYPWAYQTDGYSSDDEDTPLMMGRSLRSKRPQKKKRLCSRIFRNILLAALCLVLVTVFFVLYRAKPLTDISIEMGRVLASDKELIFDLRVKANNWNWWTVRVTDADISMFAFSQVVPFSDGGDANTHGVDPAEYLGSFYRFDEPLSFPPAMFSGGPVEASSQIRIKSPGADKSGNERWSRIIRYPYGLVARGVLKYHPLPVGSAYSQSVAICDVARVEPTSGVVSEDPDQSYCLKHG